MTSMRSIVHRRYGDPGLLEVGEQPSPDVPEDGVVVRVLAASVNPLDWHTVTGRPMIARLGGGLRRPARAVPGVDVAGVVEAVSPGAGDLRVGDLVAGGARGSFAQLAPARASALARIPDGVAPHVAAALPIAGLTALQAVRDAGRVASGQRVLVIGASGGVGTFAVQLARAAGAEVTGVCSSPNADLVRSLGAAQVIDHTAGDLARAVVAAGPFDVIVDNVGSVPLGACKRALVATGRYVVVGGATSGALLGALRHLLHAKASFALGRRSAVAVLARQGSADMADLLGRVAAGTLQPVVGRTITLDQVPAAVADVGRGHTRGKVVVAVADLPG